MNTVLLLMLLKSSLLYPNQNYYQPIQPIQTVEQGLTILRQDFPDWQKNYQANVFDCSEMSALVNQFFLCQGFDSHVVRGYNFQDGIGGHAWVLVDGYIVEATSLYTANTEQVEGFYDRFNYTVLETPPTGDDWDWWDTDYIKSKSVSVNQVVM